MKKEENTIKERDHHDYHHYPTQQELDTELKAWEEYSEDLSQIVQLYKKRKREKQENEEREQREREREKEYKREQKRLKKMTPEQISRERMIKSIKDLFEKYVECGIFKEDKVVDNSDLNEYYGNSGTRSGSYNYDGVEITYLSRCIHHKGDYDMFTDYTVRVNGMTIVKVEKE